MNRRVKDVLVLCATFLLVYGGAMYFGLLGVEQDKTGGIARIALCTALVAIVKVDKP